MMDFDFEIRYKKGSKMPTDILSRSFIEVGAISALNINWANKQEKDNLSNLIKESLDKKWVYNFPCQNFSRKQNFSQAWQW